MSADRRTILITGARIVNEGEIREGDLLVAGGRIAAVGGDLSGRPADEVIEARGRFLLPGLIDDQVHFREPGLTHKADLATESRAAVAGGVTSFMDMPNVNPPTLTPELLEERCALAAGKSAANYAFYLGASNDNLGQVRRLEPGRACGVKVFMGSSTGNMLVDDPDTLAGIFRDAPGLVAVHCEDDPAIRANERIWRARHGDDVPMDQHPIIRSREACLASSSLAVDLAREHGTRLHVLHLTTAEELALFQPGPVADKRITAEVCVHHLWFSDADYARLGGLIKCNPAIKTAADRAALRAALVEGRIDVVATDHAPHTRAEKANPYFGCPSGLPLVQHLLPALHALSVAGVFDLPTLVEKACHNPARLFGVRERGFLREGWWADLVLLDPAAPVTVREDAVLAKCGWSPFTGVTFPGHVDLTMVSGRVAWRDGRIVPGVRGERLAFDR
ncbi:MAG TPA: dihydroorotase [Candidatus Krumholzibacteria bacterium]|nr:dihydroorotase [Candidatus Krumholzibacteria bacterium]